MAIEIIRHNLSRSVAFLEPYLPLLDSHMVNYITDSLFDIIPFELREDINKMSGNVSLFNALENNVLNMMFKHCEQKNVDNTSQIGKFMNSLLDLHKSNRSVDFYTLEDFRNALYRNGCKKYDILHINEFMSAKKCHEVKLMSVLVAEITNYTNCKLVLDIGDGKGYLSSFLALEYKLRVLGLDASNIKTSGAAKRSERLNKRWKGTRKKYAVENEAESSENSSNISDTKRPDYRQITEFISDSTDISKIIVQEFSETIDKVGLVGLHTCGDLSPVCLRLFANNPDQKSLINVGCCYHLLTGVDDNKETAGFPMSKYLRDISFKLSRNARMVSLKPKWKIGSEHTIPCSSLLYRAILQKIFVDKKGSNLPDEVKVGRMKTGTVSCFSEYVKLGIKKLKMDITLTDDEIQEYWDRWVHESNRLWLYFMLLVSLSSLVEDIILMDRLLYLKEQGIDNSYLVEIFDPTVSPRCHGVVAFKN